MPLISGKGEEDVEFVWFCPDVELKDSEVEVVRGRLGLRRDIQAQAQANADDSAFADLRPNGDSWQDAQGVWHIVSFASKLGDRFVSVHSRGGRWSRKRWFGGSKSSAV